MTDALKLAEEALAPFESFGKYLADHPRSGTGDTLYGWDNAEEASLRQSDLKRAVAAASSIRAARAEWGWRPIAEYPAIIRGVLHLGTWVEGHGWVTMKSETYSKGMDENGGWTHFYIEPQLPPPPTREEVGNG